MSLSIGVLIGDRYRLIRKIAVGGMGEVWEAADTRLGRRVAVKVLKAELSGSSEFLQRFRVEARTTASLNHPGIAAVHDYGETAAGPGEPAETAYLVMELVEGEPLAAMIARRRRLTPERTLDVLEQAGNALQAAHERGLVHRDVKPGNILLTGTGTVKLTDFGIAKAVDAAPVTRSGMVMGTAHYIAPEQAMGQEAGPASDVYSLGVVGYECLTGHRPFRSDSAVTVAMMHIREAPPPLPPDIPPGVRALIEATLVKDPRARYGTGGEFAAAVAAVRARRPLPRPGAPTLQLPLRGGGGSAGAGAGATVRGAPHLPGIIGMPGAPGVIGTPGAQGLPGAQGVPGGVPGAGLDDEPPTGPQPRLGMPRNTSVAVGPPTPLPPGGGPYVPPHPHAPFTQQPRPVPMSMPPRRQLEPRIGLWVLIGLLLVVAMVLGAWGLVTALAAGPLIPPGINLRSHRVTVRGSDYPGYLSRAGAATCLVTGVQPAGDQPLSPLPTGR